MKKSTLLIILLFCLTLGMGVYIYLDKTGERPAEGVGGVRIDTDAVSTQSLDDGPSELIYYGQFMMNGATVGKDTHFFFENLEANAEGGWYMQVTVYHKGKAVYETDLLPGGTSTSYEDSFCPGEILGTGTFELEIIQQPYVDRDGDGVFEKNNINNSELLTLTVSE